MRLGVGGGGIKAVSLERFASGCEDRFAMIKDHVKRLTKSRLQANQRSVKYANNDSDRRGDVVMNLILSQDL